MEQVLLDCYDATPLARFSNSQSMSLCLIRCLYCRLLFCFQVDIEVSSVLAHFSPLLYGAIMELIVDFNILRLSSDSLALTTVNGSGVSAGFWFSIAANVKSIGFLIDFESDVENACSLMLLLQILNIRYVDLHIVLLFINQKRIYH